MSMTFLQAHSLANGKLATISTTERIGVWMFVRPTVRPACPTLDLVNPGKSCWTSFGALISFMAESRRSPHVYELGLAQQRPCASGSRREDHYVHMWDR